MKSTAILLALLIAGAFYCSVAAVQDGQYISHDPIWIDGDSQFKRSSWK